jgi:hypothetical protein
MASSMTKALDAVKENKGAVAVTATATAAAVAALFLYRRARNAVPKAGPYPPETLPAGAYDAVVVGAGTEGPT